MQKKFLKILGLLIPLSFALAGLLFFFRQEVLLFLLKIEKTPALSLQSEVTLNPEVHWFDDYYTIQKIDTKTIIISEPRYWQFNNNYLIFFTYRIRKMSTRKNSNQIDKDYDFLQITKKDDEESGPRIIVCNNEIISINGALINSSIFLLDMLSMVLYGVSWNKEYFLIMLKLYLLHN